MAEFLNLEKYHFPQRMWRWEREGVEGEEMSSWNNVRIPTKIYSIKIGK